MFVAVLCINANIATNVIKTKQGPLFCEKETATTSKQAAAAFHDSKNRKALTSRFFSLLPQVAPLITLAIRIPQGTNFIRASCDCCCKSS